MDTTEALDSALDGAMDLDLDLRLHCLDGTADAATPGDTTVLLAADDNSAFATPAEATV